MAEAGPAVTSSETPLFGGSWRRLYLLVLANLAFWIGAMALITWAFA
ncbi:MAG: hypothetical protein MUF10_07730 [Thermoanaerobaculaceae bacterium]|nr:hypothetical protein [Thermoanaerobaculaceae bacterium]